MAIITIVTMLALLQFMFFAYKVAIARETYGVKAPAITGNEHFERYFRVHYNTLEHLVMFIPGLWAFGFYVSYLFAALLGAVYLIGRILYFKSYINDPNSRTVGAVASTMPCVILAIGALVGALITFV